MTRTVADAALLMSVVARPDARDFMSLPDQELDFAALDAARAEAACASASCPTWASGCRCSREVRAAAEAAATALAGAGCAVESIRSFLTEEMLDGMCRFFEARSYNDLMQLSAAKRDEGAAVRRRVVHLARGEVLRPRRDAGLHAGDGDARSRGRRGAASYDFILSPTSPILAYEAELPAPGNDPQPRAAAHRIHRALQHVGAARGVDQLELQRRRPADRRAGDRQALRRCRRAAAFASPRAAAAHRSVPGPNNNFCQLTNPGTMRRTRHFRVR